MYVTHSPTTNKQAKTHYVITRNILRYETSLNAHCNTARNQDITIKWNQGTPLRKKDICLS
jgi:hypothetical protein